MVLPDFIRAIEKHDFITLVGPLLGGSHTPERPTIYVDGGADFSPAAKSNYPVFRVGDGDSARGDLDERIPAQKDYSDLAYVLRALNASVRRIEMLGFTGGRRDHELANLGEVHHYLSRAKHFSRVDIIGKAETIHAFAHGGLELSIEDNFSVMVFESSRVKISGDCEYKFDDILQTVSSHGLSNFGRGTVKVESQKPCFVFLPARGT